MVIAVQQKLFLDEFEDFGGTFHFGVAEEIDAEGEQGATVGLFADVGFQACEFAGLDADSVAYMDAGGVDGDFILGIAYHAHEVFHLFVGDAGEVSTA